MRSRSATSGFAVASSVSTAQQISAVMVQPSALSSLRYAVGSQVLFAALDDAVATPDIHASLPLSSFISSTSPFTPLRSASLTAVSRPVAFTLENGT